MKNIYKFLLIITFTLLLAVKSVSAITITPTRFEFSSHPGQTISDVLKVYNESDKKITLKIEIQSFTAQDEETGQPQFYTPEEHELATWIQVSENTIDLEAGARREIPFVINIPADAAPGGHYASIFWVNEPVQGSETGVGIIGKTGHLVLVRVAGDVVESGELVDFNLKDNKKFYPYFDIEFLARFANSGNVHFKPMGEITIHNFWGKEIVSIPVNEEEGNVLPGTTRKFNSVWQKDSYSDNNIVNEWQGFGLGRYKAKAQFEFGSNGQTEIREITFWVLPWRLIIISLIVVVGLVLVMKIYNKIIIKKALKNNQ